MFQMVCLFSYHRSTRTSGLLSYHINLSEIEGAHASRLTRYYDPMQGTKVCQNMIDLGDKNKSRYEVIDKIVDSGKDKEGVRFRVGWMAFRTSAIGPGSFLRYVIPTY